jgi:sugar diacid utilization regulator
MPNIDAILPKFIDINDRLLTFMEYNLKDDLKQYQTAYIIFENVETIIYRYENEYEVTGSYLKTISDLCRMWCIFECEAPLLKELEKLCDDARFHKL